MKRIWFSIIAAGLLTVVMFSPVAGEDAVTLDLDAVDDSGVSGSVRLAVINGGSDVEVLITAGLRDGAVHPVHIHDGTCEELGGVAYPLDDIVGGVSQTTVDADLDELLDGAYAINVHLSADEMQVNIACADIGDPAVGGPAPDDDDDAVEDDDAVVDDADDAVEDDDAVVDDAAEDDEMADDQEIDADDEASEEDDHADDVEDEVVPAAGSVGGPSSDSIALMVAVMAASLLGVGVLVRRQATHTTTGA